jgi:hypothetical protein
MKSVTHLLDEYMGLRGPSILSILFAASWEAVGPRKGRSPLTGNFSAT